MIHKLSGRTDSGNPKTAGLDTEMMKTAVPGLIATAAIAGAAELISRRILPAAPAVVLALAAGALAGNLLSKPMRAALAPGLDVVKKRVLRAAIIIYGLGITAGNLRGAGV